MERSGKMGRRLFSITKTLGPTEEVTGAERRQEERAEIDVARGESEARGEGRTVCTWSGLAAATGGVDRGEGGAGRDGGWASAASSCRRLPSYSTPARCVC